MHRGRSHHQRRSVIPRTGEQVDVVRFVASDLVGVERRPEVSLVDRCFGQPAADALRSPRGARRVVHYCAERAIFGRQRYPTGFKLVMTPKSIDGSANYEHLFRRKPSFLDRETADIGVTLMHD